MSHLPSGSQAFYFCLKIGVKIVTVHFPCFYCFPKKDFAVLLLEIPEIQAICYAISTHILKHFFSHLTETSLYQASLLLSSLCIDKLQGHSQRLWHEVSGLEGPLLVSRSFSFLKLKYLWELGEFGGVCTR